MVRFARADRKSHQNSHTFYLTYEGPPPAASPREIKVDVTIREQFVRPANDRPVLRGYEEYADLPEDAAVRVYALEEIGVEKLVALTDKARNEPRDLYDLWHLTSEGLVDFATLVPEIEAKLAFRGRTRDAMTAEIATKEARYKKLWAVRLGQQMATLPPFDAVTYGGSDSGSGRFASSSGGTCSLTSSAAASGSFARLLAPADRKASSARV